ncbi:MAG: ISAzo13 family transposase [Nanoarchaeota archaeon]
MAQNQILRRYNLLEPFFTEKTRRFFAAAEAKSIGRGGIAIVAPIVKLERHTISRGIKELEKKPIATDRIRRSGAGRKKATVHDTGLQSALESLVEPATRGDPESPLRYISKSTRHLAKELNARHHHVSHQTIASILKSQNYSLQANAKIREGKQHPDRNAQFEFINDDVKKQSRRHEPVISVDTKKKELVGDFKNHGREWHLKGEPTEVRTHDFEDPKLGKAVPFGVFDLVQNKGWVNVGIDHDTAAFAVESIRQWWLRLGAAIYPHATTLTITADSGGSNSYRARLWKYELQRFANETELKIRVRHFPPGTSKWNKIEHRLFSFISKNWRATPLRTLATIINLIGSTTTTTGLKVYARLDTKKYPKGVKISDNQFATINLFPEKFHGEWNYTIKPTK